jgi:hypothetical protein
MTWCLIYNRGLSARSAAPASASFFESAAFAVSPFTSRGKTQSIIHILPTPFAMINVLYHYVLCTQTYKGLNSIDFTVYTTKTSSLIWVFHARKWLQFGNNVVSSFYDTTREKVSAKLQLLEMARGATVTCLSISGPHLSYLSLAGDVEVTRTI